MKWIQAQLQKHITESIRETVQKCTWHQLFTWAIIIQQNIIIFEW